MEHWELTGSHWQAQPHPWQSCPAAPGLQRQSSGKLQSCRLGPGHCSGSGCSQQQLPKQSCSTQVCAVLYCSPSSAFLENNYPFHQQSAPGKAPTQQMHRGKSLTEMGAEKRPGRNEEKRFSFVPQKGKENPPRMEERSVWKASPDTTLSITYSAPKLQSILEKNMQTSHMENTIWKCSKTSYIFHYWQLLSIFKEKKKRQQHPQTITLALKLCFHPVIDLINTQHSSL